MMDSPVKNGEREGKAEISLPSDLAIQQGAPAGVTGGNGWLWPGLCPLTAFPLQHGQPSSFLSL